MDFDVAAMLGQLSTSEKLMVASLAWEDGELEVAEALTVFALDEMGAWAVRDNAKVTALAEALERWARHNTTGIRSGFYPARRRPES